MAIKKNTSIAATGASSDILIKQGRIRVTGTWAGTINVQTDLLNDDGWVNESDVTGADLAYTANFSLPVDNAVPTLTRVYFTRTSGTAVVDMQGE